MVNLIVRVEVLICYCTFILILILNMSEVQGQRRMSMAAYIW